jgi:hypothetical protein
MGKALEILTGFVTAPSTTQVALTMASGNVLTIRNAPLDSQVALLQAWVDSQGAGTLRIRSPRLHDNVQGIRLGTVISEVQPLLPWSYPQKLIPQDVLTVDLSGSATAGDIETACLLLYYGNIAGVDARLASADDVMRRMVNVLSVEVAITAVLTGGYGGERAINADYDLLKANTDYALLGYLVNLECAAVRWRGVDTGNLGVGGPGNDIFRALTTNWFVRLSQVFNLPLIPIFNSANRAGILVDVASDENAATIKVVSILAEIGPAAVGTAAAR